MKINCEKRFPIALASLTLAGLAIRLYMALIDPFLHTWDERFHALVAKNFITDPFYPLLRSNPLFKPDFTSWTQGSVWVHKQPLFMWQISLSLKVFGVNEYAVRYPSVIMGTLMIPMIFRIAKSISNNDMISLLAAGIFCFSNFHLELVGGIRSMDHNDLCFEFYLLTSVWAWVKYENTQRKYWVILIGIFAGAAILNKWLIGLFVFLVWGIKIIAQARKTKLKSEIINFLLALAVCSAVFVPWQLYIINRFPVEAAYEYTFNVRHITEALESHDGDSFFYISRFPQLLGEGIFMLVFTGLYLHFKSSEKNKKLAIPILGGVLFVFIFLSLVVKTKVISHIFFIAPFLMIYMGYSLRFIICRIKRKPVIIAFLFGIGMLDCKPEKIILDQEPDNIERSNAIFNASVYKNLKHILPDDIKVVANMRDFVSIMFYNNGITAYESFSAEQLEVLKKKRLKIAVFKSINGVLAPEYLLKYPYINVINIDLKSQ